MGTEALEVPLAPVNGEEYLAKKLADAPELTLLDDGWSDYAIKAAFDAGLAARDTQMARALTGLLLECEPDPIDLRYTRESQAFREGSNSDRRVQAKLIIAAAATLGLVIAPPTP